MPKEEHPPVSTADTSSSEAGGLTIVPSAEARRLDLLLVREGWDGQLATLVSWVQTSKIGIGVELELIVDGVRLRGVLAPSESFGKDVDEKIAKGMESATLTGDVDKDRADEFRAEMAEMMRGLHNFETMARTRREQYERARERFDAHLEALPEGEEGKLDAVPGELWSDLVEVNAPPVILTLSRAAYLEPGVGWQEVAHMRVHLDHIGAWWLR